MKVTVRYFASLRESLGKDREEIELPASVSTVAGLRGFLRSKSPAHGEALNEKRLVKAAVNQDMAAASAAIKAGDEVAFFPPVTGG